MSALIHGGDLEAFGERHPEAPRPLIDLSTGINPVPFEPTLDNGWMYRLPGDSDEHACRTAFATYTGVDEAFVHVMPGTQAIISSLPHLIEPKKVAVLSPTYGEHEAAWRAAGHAVSTFPAGEILKADADIIVVTNPNNPDGHVFRTGDLAECQARQKARGGWLIVDEAFVDCAPGLSVAARIQTSGLMVLRSFGKFFGLAGLRLGCLIAPVDWGAAFTERLGPWRVSTPALRIAAEAYGDEVWIEETRHTLDRQMERLRKMTVPALGREIGQTPLFILLNTEHAGAASAHLAAHGIFVRTFPNMPNWLRLGLPGEPWAWGRLETALTEWKHQQ